MVQTVPKSLIQEDLIVAIILIISHPVEILLLLVVIVPLVVQKIMDSIVLQHMTREILPICTHAE
jgi:hypothetical protein